MLLLLLLLLLLLCGLAHDAREAPGGAAARAGEVLLPGLRDPGRVGKELHGAEAQPPPPRLVVVGVARHHRVAPDLGGGA